MAVNSLLVNSSSVVNIDIPRFEKVVGPSGKEYTIYKITIAKAGGTKEIDKRYSEFDKLHRRLNKNRKLPRNIEFPPKTFIFSSGSASTKEARRTKLKTFLQQLCDLSPIPDEVLAFLGISQPIQSNLMNSSTIYSSSEDLLDSSKSYTHQPLLDFTNDPYILHHDDDILVTGILDSFYNDCNACS